MSELLEATNRVRARLREHASHEPTIFTAVNLADHPPGRRRADRARREFDSLDADSQAMGANCAAPIRKWAT